MEVTVHTKLISPFTRLLCLDVLRLRLEFLPDGQHTVTCARDFLTVAEAQASQETTFLFNAKSRDALIAAEPVMGRQLLKLIDQVTVERSDAIGQSITVHSEITSNSPLIIIVVLQSGRFSNAYTRLLIDPVVSQDQKTTRFVIGPGGDLTITVIK